MSEKLNKNDLNFEERLDDESRVKVLSPSALVAKRFVRNKLGVTGAIILILMFVFSFFGVFLSPHGQTQVFEKTENIVQDYAHFSKSEDIRYISSPEEPFTLADQAKFVLAKNKEISSFEAGKDTYNWEAIAPDVYIFSKDMELASVRQLPTGIDYKPLEKVDSSDEFKIAFEEALDAGSEYFEFEEENYKILSQGKKITISKVAISALGSKHVFDAYSPEDREIMNDFYFRLAVEKALSENVKTITFDEKVYTLESEAEKVTIYAKEQEENLPFAVISNMLGQAVSVDITLTPDFKAAVIKAIEDKEKSFFFADDNDEEIEYFLTTKNGRHTIRKEMPTRRIDMYGRPNKVHLLGTDANGMDVLTRLMYGGRVSLMVGFVVVIIELLIGVTFGGIAGYFGGWIDTLFMRVIDLINSIPQYPILIIIGAVMDSARVDPFVRIWFLMALLGLLGWTGIARIVRGQILTLREQDFMIATEATGIRVSRRIFRHLVPNIMPLLIVQATMSLGGIIITEATLSFLGLGLKYPLASWGTIINAATDVHIMTNYWFIWIPAGVLILITVLGFNFVGDGLRDAFDPKMKR